MLAKPEKHLIVVDKGYAAQLRLPFLSAVGRSCLVNVMDAKGSDDEGSRKVGVSSGATTGEDLKT